MRSTDLSSVQLEIVMHLANGKRFDEIAQEIDRCTANVKKHALAARRKKGARTLPHLVSIVIASGQLEWTESGRVTSTSQAAQTSSVP
jgi:DNA-binding NarL/FixJ family response regulator